MQASLFLAKNFNSNKKAPRLFGRGAISRVFAKSGLRQPSRFRRPWQKLPDRRRRDTTACSLHQKSRPPVFRMLSPPRLVNTSRSGSHLADALTRANKKAPRLFGRGAISRVFAKSGLRRPSRFRRPWQKLPDRRRPSQREPYGSC